ncbi:hypothetical protein [Bradyrhizobium sp. CCBAU 21360]|uniref:hypothetical protein n=1 Tax=Bradyrhizobium sp. CCBAU 21360 TaxID=1325081 RepID=UPI002304D7D6|nr:hypothetical protein [Bradyrhizobium sp. CCBAU 21360]
MTNGPSKGDLRFDFDLRKNEISGEDRETGAWESRGSEEAAGGGYSTKLALCSRHRASAELHHQKTTVIQVRHSSVSKRSGSKAEKFPKCIGNDAKVNACGTPVLNFRVFVPDMDWLVKSPSAATRFASLAKRG